MKLLLTSSGVNNKSILNALVTLLGKPVSEANALFIPTAIYPFAKGSFLAGEALWGDLKSRLAQLGWKSMGLLELTALPSIDKKVWAASIEAADVLLAWGGDPFFLSYWLTHSGLIDFLSSKKQDLVYVGVSAGSMAMSSTFAETYSEKPGGRILTIASEDITFSSPQGDVLRTLVTGHGAGLVEFAIIPHYENSKHWDACGANAEKWAAKLPVPVYAIDDQTALKVIGSTVEVISEGQWKLFN